jgi:hypothetical protein
MAFSKWAGLRMGTQAPETLCVIVGPKSGCRDQAKLPSAVEYLAARCRSERKTGEFLMNTDPVSGDKSAELQAEIDRLSEKLGVRPTPVGFRTNDGLNISGADDGSYHFTFLRERETRVRPGGQPR